MDFDLVKIDSWLKYAVMNDHANVHLEEFVDIEGLERLDVYIYSKEVFLYICKWLKKQNIKEKLFELHIELDSENSEIKHVPNKFEGFINSIEPLGCPEFFLSNVQYRPYFPNHVVLEYYQSSFPFRFEMQDVLGYNACYNEYRSIEEYKENLPFSRQVVFSFVILDDCVQ